MRVVRDLCIGNAPSPFEVFYCGSDTDSTTKRYKGSLVKLMDIDDVDHGVFFTSALVTTAYENIAGILEEETSADYTLDNQTYPPTRRKITPIFPTSVVRAEYARKDAAGTSNTDATATASAAGTTLAIADGTADYLIGGYVYFLTGDNAGYLHYIHDNDGSSAIVVETAFAKAVVAADTFLVICPPHHQEFLFDATATGLKSEIDDTARSSATSLCIGLEYWISAPGVGMTRLEQSKHDGICIPNARFYHDLLFTGMTPVAGGPGLLWTGGIAPAA